MVGRNLENPEMDAVIKKSQQYMYEGKYEGALREVNKALQTYADSCDLLYIKAVAHRYLNELENAQITLKTLKGVSPEFGRLYQEEGYLFLELGEDKKAVNAFSMACQYNPALMASWKALVSLHEKMSHAEGVKFAKQHLKRLQELPTPLLQVTHLVAEEKLIKGEVLCKNYLKTDPLNTEGMRLLADIATKLGVLNEAEYLLEAAINLAPDNIQIRLDFIQILRKRQKFKEALGQAKELYERNPANPVFKSQYAVESMQSGDYERALGLFDEILDILPHDYATLTSKGHALKTIGDQEGAITSYSKACRVKPSYGDAFYALANLKTYSFSDSQIEIMSQALRSMDISHQHRVHFSFALAKAYEDRKRYEQAFTYYEMGNDLKRTLSRYDAALMTEELQAQSEICTDELFLKNRGSGDLSPDPIFIVGLPRAGSTLLEQILASHSQVDGTLELPNILSITHELRGKNKTSGQSEYPEVLNKLTNSDFVRLGQAYISDTRIHRQGAPFFIDKMPNNFRHIGLIHLILPNAKIIDARRHPMACCFSGFKQLFAEGQEFTYGLHEIGTYYRDYVRLMQHWDHVLPGKILKVVYEDVVADLEGQTRRILNFLDLEFEEECLQFHKTERSVRTASSEQVRQPIFTKGLEQWRNFEPWLDSLKHSLGTSLHKY